MPKITIQPVTNSKEQNILIDDVALAEKIDLGELILETASSLKILGKCCVSEILEFINILYADALLKSFFKEATDLNLFEITSFYIQSTEKERQNKPLVSYVLTFNLVDWKLAWSVNEFIEEFFKAFFDVKKSDMFAPCRTDILSDFHDESKVIFPAALLKDKAQSSSLEEVLICFSGLLSEVNDLTLKRLYSKADAQKMVEFFRFPEEVKTACSQYLQYFYEFLKDLDIKAKVDVTERQSGEILFSVIPEEKNEALENIRLALDVYLRLPSSKIDADVSDIRIQALNAQILYFKSQLVMAAATIQQQQSTINNLQFKPLPKDILVVAHKNDGEGQEPLFGGLIKIGEVELGNGAFTFNLPQIIRWLKQAIGKS